MLVSWPSTSIADRYRFASWRTRFHGLIAEGSLGGRKTYLLKPMTYMNDGIQMRHRRPCPMSASRPCSTR
jgi:peptidyl-tRNA hydrolase